MAASVLVAEKLTKDYGSFRALSAFDLARQGKEELSPEDKLQLGAIQRKQDEVEAMTRKLRAAVGEQP